MKSDRRCLPQAYHDNLMVMQRWLAKLEQSTAVHAPPTSDDAQVLGGLFSKLWAAAGMDASLGLVRSTPDHRLFRAVLGDYFMQSPLVRRCFDKPRGYAGDHLMMEAVCNEPPPAMTALGQWLTLWFHDYFPPFVSVRNRRDAMAAILVAEHSRGARRVLNVACGAAPELARTYPSVQFDEVALLDQDPEALQYAKSSLADAGAAPVSQIRTICSPIQALVRSAEPAGLGEFDVIYSMGLYDYLDEKRGQALTGALWKATAPGGLFVVGNFQGHHWARYLVEAVMDWFLIYRDEDDMVTLAADADGARIDVTTDQNGILHLLQLRKGSQRSE